MNRLTKVKYWLPITAIGIFVFFALGLMIWDKNVDEKMEQPQNLNQNYIIPRGIEALDLNVDTIKVIVENQSAIPLLDQNSDYAYDGFVARDNGTNIDIIFTVYDKTNSSLSKIPGIKHGPELIKILDNFIIHVDQDKILGVYARK